MVATDKTMISKVQALRATELLKSQPESVLEGLAPGCLEIRKGHGDTLFIAGEPCRGLFVVVTGRTRAFRHGADGREQVIHEDGPGATFPEVAVFDDGPYPSTVTAVEESVLLFIPKEEIRRLCLAHPEVALSALKILARRLRKATGMVERLALLEVSQRVAEYLVQQIPTGRLHVKGPVQILIDHNNQEIADRIGTVREVVSRSFARLQKEGWLRREGRRVTITDLEALRRHAAGE